jgi:zinc/manganese transport system substrate-binding protein
MRHLSRTVRVAALGCATLAWLGFAAARAAPPQTGGKTINVVAAENFYGDIASQLAGPLAHVTSIMSNPDQDPHLFEASPSVARSLAGARIAVMNGADYDPWMGKLLGATPSANRQTISVADLVGKKPGDNPHLWYDTANVAAYARAMAAALEAADLDDKAAFAARLDHFLDSLRPLDAEIADMHARFAGLPVTATEPVFGYMAAALGLAMRNERFQLAVMNDTEPSASDVAAFETDLRQRRVRVMLYNSQAIDSAVQRLIRIARQARVPVVPVTETEPAGKSYQKWMTDQLNGLDAALSKPPA